MNSLESINKNICVHCQGDLITKNYGDKKDCIKCGSHYWYRDDDDSWRYSDSKDEYKWELLINDLHREFITNNELEENILINNIMNFIKDRVKII